MTLSTYQQNLIWKIYNLKKNLSINQYEITYLDVNKIIKKYIYPRTQVIFTSDLTHHLYLNFFPTIDINYVNFNKDSYIDEILTILNISVVTLKDDDILPLTEEELYYRYSGYISEYTHYIGYQINDISFFGLNTNSYFMTKEILKNIHFTENFKITLFTTNTNIRYLQTTFKFFIQTNHHDFLYSQNFYNLLSLSTE